MFIKILRLALRSSVLALAATSSTARSQGCSEFNQQTACLQYDMCVWNSAVGVCCDENGGTRSCTELTDAASCTANQGCSWDTEWQRCYVGAGPCE